MDNDKLNELLNAPLKVVTDVTIGLLERNGFVKKYGENDKKTAMILVHKDWIPNPEIELGVKCFGTIGSLQHKITTEEDFKRFCVNTIPTFCEKIN